MGRLLDEYIRTNVPALEQAAAGGPGAAAGPPPGPPPGGAQTFPVPQQPAIMGQPMGPGGQPSGPMEVASPAFPPPDLPPSQVPRMLQTAPGPEQAAPEGAAFGVEPQQQGPNMEDGPDSFKTMVDDMPDEQVDAAIDAMEQSGVNIDEEHAKVTGDTGEEGEKGKKMSRREKGLILMEFGLNLMAQSGTGEGTIGGDIGKAGLAAFTGYRGREAARAKALTEAEDKKLERRKTEAEIEKLERGKTTIKTDRNGNMIIINEDTGETQPVMMDGKPVQAGDQDRLDFEVKKAAFIAAYGTEIEDEEELERRAVAFANSVRDVAFPELARADQARAIMRELNESRNSSQKFTVDGKEVRWRNMSNEQKVKVATQMVDMAMAAIEGGVSTTGGGQGQTEGPPQNIDDVNAWYTGLPEEQRGGIVEGQIYTLSNGMRVRKRNGKLEEVKDAAE